MIEPDSSAPAGASPRALAQAAGRYVVTFVDGVDDVGHRETLESGAGVSTVRSTLESDARVDPGRLADSEAVVFSRAGVAVVQASADQAAALRDARRVLAIRPARTYRVLSETAPDVLTYLLGRRDEVTDLYSRLSNNGQQQTSARALETPFRDTAALTWGLQATRVPATTSTGRNVKVAVLDTGFTPDHPDFAGRRITAQSFVSLPTPPGGLQGPQDGHGHGTHCTGTACGPATPASTRRYGVASEADIFIGKVLDDQGSGDDSSIIAGIEWALAQQCDIVSMSLGASVPEVDPAYEAIGRRALDAGTLIVAAAGNNGNRAFGSPGFVGVPANSPSIMAVAAVDPRLNVADFSARSLPFDGGQVDLAAPGVAVFSSWLLPTRYNTLQGTSMATPHVAGIAALWAEATGRRGRDLWTTLIQEAQRLTASSADVGAGLVRAPGDQQP